LTAVLAAVVTAVAVAGLWPEPKQRQTSTNTKGNRGRGVTTNREHGLIAVSVDGSIVVLGRAEDRRLHIDIPADQACCLALSRRHTRVGL
jgi:hypothetical protein